jgi:hypothetical protein
LRPTFSALHRIIFRVRDFAEFDFSQIQQRGRTREKSKKEKTTHHSEKVCLCTEHRFRDFIGARMLPQNFDEVCFAQVPFFQENSNTHQHCPDGLSALYKKKARQDEPAGQKRAALLIVS